MNLKENKLKLRLLFTIIILVALACGTENGGQDNTQPPSNDSVEEDPTVTVDPNQKTFEEAVDQIKAELQFNGTEIELNPDNFLYKENPVGGGLLIYEPETRFFGVERYFIWIYLDGTLYVPNGATKDVTPNVLWPRDADAETWARTNLDPFQATALIEYLFEGKELTPYEAPPPAQTENEEIRFGYTIEERKEIYQDIIRVEDRAVAEDKPADSYYSEVMDKYGLTYDEVKEIAIEGTLSLWPMPPEP